jgi:predicted permease
MWRDAGNPLVHAFEDRLRESGSTSGRLWLFVHEVTSLLITAAREVAAMPRMSRLRWTWRPQDDVVRALRTAGRTPVFTLTVAATLLLGLGSLAGAFHVIDAVLLRPLPYAQPDELVRLFEYNVREGIADGRLSSADYVEFQENNETLTGLAAFANSVLTMPTDDGGVLLQTELVTPDYFKTLGVPTLHGTWFTEDHFDGDKRPFVVLSHNLWQTAFGADTTIIGRSIPLGDDREMREVVGVMPASFRGIDASPDIWLPWGRIERMGSEESSLWRRMHPLSVVARRSADASLDDVQRDLMLIAQRLEQEYPEENAGHLIRVRSLFEVITGNVAAGLWLLFGAVGLVMLAAISNLAHVVVARGIERSREFAVRLALGAGRVRLALQLGAEAAVIAIPAALAAVPAGYFLANWLVTREAQLVPRSVGTSPSPATFGLVLTCGLFVTGVLALTPVVRRHMPLETSLRKAGVAGMGRRTHRLQNALVAAQVAIALILFISAGLVTRSYHVLNTEDPGFDAEGVVAAEVIIPLSRYSTATARRGLIFELQEAVGRVPGMNAVGVTSSLPLSTGGGVVVYGPDIAVTGRQAEVMNVDAGSFEVLQIPLISGRPFTSADRHDGPRVAIINRTFARTFFPDISPLGQTVTWGSPDAAPFTVVGVAADVKQAGPIAPAPPILYMNAEQSSQLAFYLVGRTSLDETEQLVLVREAIQRVDPALVPWQLTTLEEAVAATFTRQRMSMAVIIVLALITVTVSVIGVYGVFTHQLATRRREIGLRMALGATAHRVRTAIVRDALIYAGGGIAVGLAATALLAPFVGSVIHGIAPIDPWSFSVASMVLLGLSALAAWIPARRSSAADPSAVLRQD